MGGVSESGAEAAERGSEGFVRVGGARPDPRDVLVGTDEHDVVAGDGREAVGGGVDVDERDAAAGCGIPPRLGDRRRAR